MSKWQRIALFIPRVTWPLLVLAAILPLIVLVTQGTEAAAASAVGVVVGIGIVMPLFLSPYWIYRVLQVRRSHRRVANVPDGELVSPGVAAWLAIAIGVVLVSAAGFGLIPSGASRVIEESRSQAEMQLNRIEAIDREIDDTAPANKDWDESSVIKTTGIKPTAGNIAVVHQENLADLTRNLMFPRGLPVVMCNPMNIVTAASLVRKGRWSGGERVTMFDSADAIRSTFQSVDGLRYLLVIRKTAYEPPTSDRPGSFDAGHYRAEVLLFEIERGRFLGGFTISATNSDTIRSTNIDAETLESNLSVNAEASLTSELANHLPAVAQSEEFCRH